MSKMIKLTHVCDDEFPRFRRTVLIPEDKIIRVEELREFEIGHDKCNRTRIVLQSGDCIDSVDVEERLDDVEQRLGVV